MSMRSSVKVLRGDFAAGRRRLGGAAGVLKIAIFAD